MNEIKLNHKMDIYKKWITIGSMFFFLFGSLTGYAQYSWKSLAKRPSTLGLDQGMISLKTPSFNFKLVKASQTVAALQPKSEPGFDFTPGDSLKVRSSNGLYHLGDLNLRLRTGSTDEWKSFSTAKNRMPVKTLSVKGNILAAADLSATLPADIPLQIKRYWELQNGKLVLRFELINKTKEEVEIGSLGIPMIFNNILKGSLDQAHADNVFYDPYMGLDAGYLQVTRLNGHAPSLIVAPYGHTPFEAYNPLLNDPTPRGIDFEGFYEWMVCSKAYAENEWKNAQPWNNPTLIVLKPGEFRSYGLQFIISGTPEDIEKTLEKNNRPVAVGIPGYVLPQDVNAKLFLNYKNKVRSIEVEPGGALLINKSLLPVKHGWQAYEIRGKTWGRARLTITYQNGLVQTIQYKIIKPESNTVSDFGNFLTTKQWFENDNDPFHRSPSVISYDDEKKSQVTQENRAWIAGLSDEGGAGSWLGATMKQLVLPDKTEVDKLQHFIDETLWGHIQYSEGIQKYGVRKSLFYYAPDSMSPGTYRKDINFHTWSAWPIKEAESVGRSYNYPHVAAAYWVMYRLARNHKGLVTSQTWNWYLEHAYHTVMAMMEKAPYYAQFGQMEGTVFYMILNDLKVEGLTSMAEELETAMKKRAIHWSTLKYPFGSEMPWDSTGQEEVYIWSYFFGYEEKAEVTLHAILGYMPAIPGWAYNGNARRYWDFLYAGKLTRIERMIHHYGSALNAIPVLTEYRQKPEDFYLLRVGYGGLMGSISNITEDGFAPCAFHSFPSTLKNDGYSGDYGSGFFGYAVNTATYITNHKDFGWVAFGGNLTEKNNWVNVNLTTAAKSRIYIAPVGLWITLEAGKCKSVDYNKITHQVNIILGPSDIYTSVAYLKIEQPAHLKNVGTYTMKNGGVKERGMFTIPLTSTGAEVTLYQSNDNK